MTTSQHTPTSTSTHPSFTILNAPHRAPITQPSIFLAGTIVDDYHRTLTSTLQHLPVTILNPFRPDWSSLLPEIATNPAFVEQVTWELDMQEEADVVVIYFSRVTQAPVSLLEFGLAARRGTGRVIVGVEQGYGKEGNVRVVCERFGIRCLGGLKELAEGVLEWAGGVSVEKREGM